MDFSVDPGGGARHGVRLQDVADEPRGAKRPPGRSRCGECRPGGGDLAFASQVGAAWSDRVDEMDELARRVESSASVFEDSEQQVCDRIRRAR